MSHERLVCLIISVSPLIRSQSASQGREEFDIHVCNLVSLQLVLVPALSFSCRVSYCNFLLPVLIPDLNLDPWLKKVFFFSAHGSPIILR